MTSRPVGRPRARSAEEPRQYVGFAVPVTLKGQLEEAARQSGRSLAQECVRRLERSFRDDDIVSAVMDRLHIRESGTTSCASAPSNCAAADAQDHPKL